MSKDKFSDENLKSKILEKQVSENQSVKKEEILVIEPGFDKNGQISKDSAKIRDLSNDSQTDTEEIQLKSKFQKMKDKEKSQRMSLIQLRKKQIAEAKRKAKASHKGIVEIKRLIKVAASRD